MNRATKTSSINVGFVMFVATVVVIVTLFWVGSGTGIFQQQAQYHFMCPSTSRLKDGSRVYLSGVPVGKVDAIEFIDDLGVKEVMVTLSVAENVSRRIRFNSTVSLQSDGLLGDVSVHITMGSSDSKGLPAGEEIRYLHSSPLDALAGVEITRSASDVLRELVVVLKAIEAGDGTVGKLLREPELYDNLNSFLKSLAALSGKLDLVADDIGSFSKAVSEQKGVLGKLIFSEEYERDLGQAIASTAEVVVKLEGALNDTSDTSSVVTRLFFDKQLGERLDNVLAKLERGSESLAMVLGMLERGEGSVGQLLHDPSIAASIKDLFLGVQEIGYMRNIIQNAEMQGRAAQTPDERASAMARLEASRARMLARLNAPKDEESEKKGEVEDDPEKKKTAPGETPEKKRDGALPE